MLHALKVLFYAQICGHDYFRSRDKDGGHTIRSAVAEKPPLYANLTTLSFIELQLLPNNFYIAGIRNFPYFAKKIVENIKLSTRTAKLMQTMLKHIF